MNELRRSYRKVHNQFCPSCGIIIGIDGEESLIPKGEKICLWCLNRLDYIQKHHSNWEQIIQETKDSAEAVVEDLIESVTDRVFVQA